MAVGDYGDSGRRRLDRIRSELGLDYVEPGFSSKEARTRGELLRESGPASDVYSPGYTDMWDEEDVEGKGLSSTLTELAQPSKVIIVDQAYPYTATKVKPKSAAGTSYARPDLVPEAYGKGKNNQSTRVWGIQWIPTSADSEESGSLIGDVLVAFARPSRLQAHALYVYTANPWHSWTAFSGAASFGRAIRILGDGRPYEDSDKVAYKRLHPTIDDGDWIFGAMYMAMWSTTRPVSASGTLLSIESIESALGKK